MTRPCSTTGRCLNRLLAMRWATATLSSFTSAVTGSRLILVGDKR